MNNGMKILVVDDERQIRRMLSISLSAEGHQVTEASTGKEALQTSVMFRPDLVILDLGLPDMDGCDVIRDLREWNQVPIIILSVRDRDDDKIGALDAGADDYVTKPFSMGELLARIRAAVRRTGSGEDKPVLHFGDLSIDFAHRRVIVGTSEIKLAPTEYDILKYLTLHAGKVVTHGQLLRAVWGPKNLEGEIHYLRVYIRMLRHKIENDPSRPRIILTEPGVGYRFISADGQ
jgi:two-component system, OmpR family, KDP operon response regulator KdpE